MFALYSMSWGLLFLEPTPNNELETFVLNDINNRISNSFLRYQNNNSINIGN